MLENIFYSPWLTIGISITVGVLILFLIYTILLRRRIQARTRALEESEERFRRFFMTSKDPVFITSKEGDWLDVNQATLNLFGYKNKQELLNTKVQQIYPQPEDRIKLLAEVDQLGFVLFVRIVQVRNKWF
jgi:PAS domain-containing protein